MTPTSPQRSLSAEPNPAPTSPQPPLLGTRPSHARPPTPAVLGRLREAFRSACRTRSGIQATRMQREYFYGLREARLLSRIDPEGCEHVAQEWLVSGSPDPETARFALDVLGYLMGQGRKSAEALLAGAASGVDPELAPYALERLYSADSGGAYQSLYLRKASEGDLTALRFVGTWPDPQAVPVLRALAEKNPGLQSPASTIRSAAEGAIEREAILESPHGPERIGEILSGKNRQDFYLMDWAVRVAESRAVPNLAAICRERLDAGEAEALQIEATGLASQMLKPGHTDLQFRTAPHVQETGDRSFDDLLLLLARTGGPLNDLEQRRLRFLGYSGDPETRLAELLAEPK